MTDDMVKFCGIDDTVPMIRAKNRVCIDGHLDRAFDAIMLSREPDAVRALLVDLAHKAVVLGVLEAGRKA